VRPSEDTRERTVKRLRRGYVAGRLDTDTFSRRVDVALRTDHGTDLHGLTADLPSPRALPRGWWRRRRPAGLLAGAAGGRLLIGRSPDCQLVFADDTVSRRHAELRFDEGRWMLRDLGSANGTWVNGRRVMEAEVAPGDEVQLGGWAVRL
jgi:pSer/pThr/pTyr-binding forkhead associated (FHA) protein